MPKDLVSLTHLLAIEIEQLGRLDAGQTVQWNITQFSKRGNANVQGDVNSQRQ